MYKYLIIFIFAAVSYSHNILYINFNKTSFEDLLPIHKNPIKEFIKKENPEFVIGSVYKLNLFSKIDPNYYTIQIPYTDSSQYGTVMAIRADKYNFNVKKYEYPDKKSKLKGFVHIYLIAKRAFVVVYISDKKDIKELNNVAEWIRSKLFIPKENIMFLGYFKYPYKDLAFKVHGFTPLLKEGNERVKLRGGIERFRNSENVLVYQNSKTSAEILYNIKTKFKPIQIKSPLF